MEQFQGVKTTMDAIKEGRMKDGVGGKKKKVLKKMVAKKKKC